MQISKPNPGEAAKYAQSYIDQITETDLFEALDNCRYQTLAMIQAISEEKGNFRYAENKWTTKEVIQHVIDTERIFAYRALRFSRRDDTELPSFEENLFAPNANCENRTVKELAEEYRIVGESTKQLFSYMTAEMLDFKGKANSVTYTARILGWFTVGHNLHHNRILRERYLA